MRNRGNPAALLFEFVDFFMVQLSNEMKTSIRLNPESFFFYFLCFFLQIVTTRTVHIFEYVQLVAAGSK